MTNEGGAGRLNFDLHRFGALVAVVLALAGLIWRAAELSKQVDVHGDRLTAVESTQRADEASQRLDHDKLTEMKSGVDYLVERQRARDRRAP